jgi:hypothetical protein
VTTNLEPPNVPSRRSDRFVTFLTDIDSLKREDRRSYIVGGDRRENTAEHSWHVLIAAWALANHAHVSLSMEKVLKLAAERLSEVLSSELRAQRAQWAQRSPQHGEHFGHERCAERCRMRDKRVVAGILDFHDSLSRSIDAPGIIQCESRRRDAIGRPLH